MTINPMQIFLQAVVCLYMLSAAGRLVSGVTVAYAGMVSIRFYFLLLKSIATLIPVEHDRCLNWLTLNEAHPIFLEILLSFFCSFKNYGVKENWFYA